jgi:hypothetical protein
MLMCGVVQSLWSFFPGTLRETCRALFFQKLLYSGHKDLMVFYLYVWTNNGNRHDSYMFAMSSAFSNIV